MNNNRISSPSSSLSRSGPCEGTSIVVGSEPQKDTQTKNLAQENEIVNDFEHSSEEQKQGLPGPYSLSTPMNLKLLEQVACNPDNSGLGLISKLDKRTLDRSRINPTSGPHNIMRQYAFASHIELEKKEEKPDHTVVIHTGARQMFQAAQPGAVSRMCTGCLNFFRRCFGCAAR